jgi:hypothetical protein
MAKLEMLVVYVFPFDQEATRALNIYMYTISNKKNADVTCAIGDKLFLFLF